MVSFDRTGLGGAVPLGAAVLCLVLALPESALADKRSCLNLTQHYKQIARGASTAEVNKTLFRATDEACPELAKLALEDGASLEARDRLGAKPLSHAAAEGNAELVALYLDRGASIDARNLDGSAALFKAAENGRLEVVKLLAARGADIDLPGRSNISPLAAAAFLGSEPIVNFLLEQGADPKWVDATKKSAIVYAAGRGFPAITKQLLDAGVPVNARYGNDLTLLMWTAGHSSEAGVYDIADVMKLLIARGARLDDRDNRGRTALMIAAELGHKQAAEILLENGADKTLRDKEGKSAADLTSLTSLREKLAAAP